MYADILLLSYFQNMLALIKIRSFQDEWERVNRLFNSSPRWNYGTANHTNRSSGSKGFIFILLCVWRQVEESKENKNVWRFNRRKEKRLFKLGSLPRKVYNCFLLHQGNVFVIYGQLSTEAEVPKQKDLSKLSFLCTLPSRNYWM